MQLNLETALIVLAASVALDCLFGEHPRVLHPVVWLGKAISGGVHLAPRQGWWRQFLYGSSLAIVLIGLSGALVYAAIELSVESPILHVAVSVFFLKASMALTELLRAARRVYLPLQQDNVADAREALGSLCSRDPSDLGPEELLQATIESLAENASDSWVAPLFYFVLFGVPGAAAYRAINTLDAMIGYHGRFEALGKFSARLDDVANVIPARLTAGLLLLAGLILRKDVSCGWRVLRRDARKTPSPNAGRPMAVMAGLLRIRLGKRNVYALGDALEPVTAEKAKEATRLVACSGWIMTGLSLAGVVGVWHLWMI
jgi:adenosylcobinamide-phosphate synthase